MQPTPTTCANSRRADFRPSRAVLTALLALPVAFIGCRDPKVSVYQVPKEAEAQLPASAPVSATPPASDAVPTPTAMPPGMPGTAPDPHALQTASGSNLAWTVPTGWQSKQGSAMRKATYVIGGAAGPAELAVTAFPGDVGGEIANVNRWRGQVGLGEIGEADALAAIQRIEANGLKIGVVDVAESAAPAATRLLGGMIPYGGATWFFKLVGPNATVEHAKADFVAFLKTVKPAAASNP